MSFELLFRRACASAEVARSGLADTRRGKTKANHLAARDSGQCYASLPGPFSCHVNQTQALEVQEAGRGQPPDSV